MPVGCLPTARMAVNDVHNEFVVTLVPSLGIDDKISWRDAAHSIYLQSVNDASYIEK